MSYSIDANLLIDASDTSSPEHRAARDFLAGRAADPDLMCLTWTTLMAYQRIATHPSIFFNTTRSSGCLEEHSESSCPSPHPDHH
jgi:predicted nucleic acid-binding protein